MRSNSSSALVYRRHGLPCEGRLLPERHEPAPVRIEKASVKVARQYCGGYLCVLNKSPPALTNKKINLQNGWCLFDTRAPTGVTFLAAGTCVIHQHAAPVPERQPWLNPLGRDAASLLALIYCWYLTQQHG